MQGSLYEIYYPIPEYLNKELIYEGYLSIEIPVGYPNTGIAAPYIPLDAVYQTRSSSYIFIKHDNKAQSKEVKLGDVYGSFVEVLSGVSTGDEIIVSRTVIEGDSIESK